MKKFFIAATIICCFVALAVQPGWSENYKLIKHFGSLDGWGNAMRFPTGIFVDEGEGAIRDRDDGVKYIQRGYEGRCKKIAAVDSTKIFVADWDNHRIEKYDIEGNLLKRYSEYFPIKPYGVVVDKKCNIHTSCEYFDRIQRVNYKGVNQHEDSPQYWYYAEIGKGPVSTCDDPKGMAVDPSGNIIVADYGYRRIFVFSDQRKYLSSFSTVVDGDKDLLPESEKKNMDPMPRPVGVAVDTQGNYFVCFNKVFGVRKYTSAGTLATDFPRDLKISGSDMRLGGVALDRRGNIFVTDNTRNMVHKLTPQGSVETSWGRFGYLPGYFNKPVGIFVDSKDRVYVVDQGNHRVQIFAQ
jgi:hypothetical protein